MGAIWSLRVCVFVTLSNLFGIFLSRDGVLDARLLLFSVCVCALELFKMGFFSSLISCFIRTRVMEGEEENT